MDFCAQWKVSKVVYWYVPGKVYVSGNGCGRGWGEGAWECMV